MAMIRFPREVKDAIIAAGDVDNDNDEGSDSDDVMLIARKIADNINWVHTLLQFL